MQVQRHLPTLLPVILCIFGTQGTAQSKYVVTPAGYEFQTANSANTFPLGRVSASYQQVHDAVDMAALRGGQSMILSGMEFRPAKSYAIAARSFDVQITLSATSTTAATMSTTFSANFGPNPTIVLPYTNMNLAAGQGTNGNPNATLWKFPFKSIFIYAPSSGNLLWDWRHKNSTSNTNAFFDYVASNPTALTLGSAGKGCTATGQSGPATSTIATSGSNLVATLTNGRASSAALLVFGRLRTQLLLGCTNLYVLPEVLVAGSTDGSGTWNAVTSPSSVLAVMPYREAFVQYAFADSGLPGGFGLSNYAVGGAPANGSRYIERLWNVSASNGSETATTGSKANNGLVTTFTIL
jgi:hypothetical protein